MRYYTLATLERRGGMAFPLKDATGRINIGVMKFNPAKARHELTLSETDFLKHSRNIALLCRIPGCGVFVDSVRDDVIAEVAAPAPTSGQKEVFSNTPFFTLRKIAKEEGVNTDGLKGSKALADAINAARAAAV